MWCRQENSSNELLMKKALVWIIFRMKIETVIPLYFWLALIRFSRNIVLKKHQVDFQLLFVLLSKKWWMIVHGCEKIWNMNWTLSLWANMYVHVRRDGGKKCDVHFWSINAKFTNLPNFILIWTSFSFDSTHWMPIQLFQSSRTESFSKCIWKSRGKTSSLFLLTTDYIYCHWQNLDRISTIHVHTSFSRFAVVYMVK